MPLLTSAPASAVIDDSNNLTLSWNPIPNGTSYTDYNHWLITVDATNYRFPGSGAITIDPLQPSQTFTQTLGSGSHTLTMQAFSSSDESVPLTLPWQTNNVSTALVFPTPISPSSAAFNLSSVLLGQTLTVTLDPGYTGADQWRVLWPDNTTTGWLPLSANVVAKSFSTPGAQNIVIQTRRDYSAVPKYNPAVTLIRQTTKQIFVVDQEFSTTESQQGGLTGDLGLGGQQGFEITDASSPTATPNAWEVIARGFVRDTITNELKLLVATTRFSNASSLFGTMAIDVFPIEGRPKSVELIEPVYELQVTNTSTTPVKIGTSAISDLIVGKSVAQALGSPFTMTTKTGTGVAPFLWSAVGLPDGVVMSSSGVINGTPIALGVFDVTFAVQDGDIPFSIDEVTLPITVTTDLQVQIATNQTDAINTTLAPLGTSLGVAQVLKPYKVQMQVGNTNPLASTPGGLPPYTWSIPAGALPVGLSIDPDTGIVSGLPCTYNSTSDYSATYTAVIQVTDAIGAKATQTYTMSLIAAPLQFGAVDQQTIYSSQDFKLVVPIFGGQSPYTFDNFFPPSGEAGYYTVSPSSIIDGQVELVANVPTTGTGTRSFILAAHDTASTSKTQTLTYGVANQISDIRMTKAFVDHVWGYNDTAAATPLAVTGDFSGYTLAGVTLTLSAAANASGGQTVYTGNIGATSYASQYFTVKGFSNAANNGVFQCVSSTTTTITLANPAGVAETHAAKAIENLSPTLSNGIGAAVDAIVPEVDFTGPASLYQNSQLRIPLQLSQSNTTVAIISREYTTLAHNDQASPGDIGTIACYPHPYIVNDPTIIGLNPRKPYYNSPNVASFNGPPNTNWTARVQTGSVLPPGLSLDANTGLIYGKLVGLSTAPSVIEYIDGGGAVHGTVTINWTTYQNDFTLNDSFSNADGHQIGIPYTAPGVTVLSAQPGQTLSSVSVVYPSYTNLQGYGLPSGTTLSIDNTNTKVLITGTPLEAGYFDLWLRVTGSNGTAYAYHRLSVDYTKPMVILTSSLPDISAQPYVNTDGSSVKLQGYGGIPPYTWSSPQFPGGVGTGVLAGLTLTTNADNTATISGTLTSPPGTSPTQLFTVGSPLVMTLTDTRGATASVSKNFTLTYDNRLRIITPAVPTIVSSTDYGFKMQALGGQPPYFWKIDNAPALPTGITFDNIDPTYSGPDRGGGADANAGAFSGTYSLVPVYSQSIGITVKDSLGATNSGYLFTGNPYLIQTGPAELLIDSTKVGTVNRGVPYQGTLTLTAGTQNFTAPISWQVAPTATHPNTLLSGLSLLPDSATQGVNAIIAGTYSGTPHQVENIYKIVGNGATAVVTTKQVHGFLNGQSVVIAGTSNFDGTYTITAVIDSVTFSFASAVTATESPASATATDATNLYVIRVLATDANGKSAVSLLQLNTGTDLQITTSSLPNATVGGSYSVQLTNSGGVPTYTWAVDPLTPGYVNATTIPGTGLSISGAGVISGTASGIFNVTPIFRVTDSCSAPNNIARAALNLVSQASGLAITTVSVPAITAGRTYSYQLQAAGSVHTPYTWSIVGGALPSPLTLDPTTGTISTANGTTNLVGFSQPVTFRVTDSISAHVDKTFTISVIAGLSLVTGIDFVDGTSLGVLGYVATGLADAVNPRPNLSFYVIATGVTSTVPSNIAVTVGNSNISATVTQITGGNAYIKLSGTGFDNGSVGSNNVTVSVTDNGVTASQSFTWVVYNNGGVLRLGATLPTQLTTP